jgi:hypothetical protein
METYRKRQSIFRHLSREFDRVNVDPRSLMERDLPKWMQPFLTKLTAKPYTGEQSHGDRVITNLVATFTFLILGVSLSSIGSIAGSYYLELIPLGWIFTTHGTRNLRLTIIHACSHHSVFTVSKYNLWLGEFISILTLTPKFRDYQRGHTKIHHSRQLMNPGDETFNYLFNVVSFRPGMTVEAAWHHLWKTLFSPTFYIDRFAFRLVKTFISDSPFHNLLAVGFWSMILILVGFTNSWLTFILTWVIPISIFFESSSLLRQCVEHRFAPTTAQMTAAIFCGEATPQIDANTTELERYLAWTNWWLRMLFYHLPSRFLVLTGDSPCHDWHHRNVGSRKWIASIFERQQEVEAGVKYYHDWGLLDAIDAVFQSFATQPSPFKDD